ncbi:hypothetical protein ZIOFF_076117 [Zingiber officinale]|uniref:AT-hook motif nuclear-localized protein n=1 Tax=Zingiber officinale TaxID=94328 RepID=A0A8J5C3K3_ZINOF|nr:hypothetical protein ZIOFF_076117 [Zingiber officinale]
MDGRDAMAMPGVVPYYIAHRGIPGSVAASQPGLHLAAQSLSIQSAGVGSGAFRVDSPPAASAHGGSELGEGANLVESVNMKRGRPRKYGPDGAVALALSPSSLSAPSGTFRTGSGLAPGAGIPTQKRGRGRPLDTGRKQQLASLGEWVAGSAGLRFTPHVIMIAVGEGRFEILCLSGSCMMTDNGGSRSRTRGLSISLSNTDGRVIGGGVAGVLIATTPVQVIVGSFIYTEPKAKNKAKAGRETNRDIEQTASYASLPNPNSTASPIVGGWPGSRQLDLMNAHIDINSTRG